MNLRKSKIKDKVYIYIFTRTVRHKSLQQILKSMGIIDCWDMLLSFFTIRLTSKK